MLDPKAEADLRWFLSGASEAELGMRSNFGSMVACLNLGCAVIEGGVISTDLPEHRLEAARKDRQVRRALEEVPLLDKAVLGCVYGPLGAFRLPAFGKLTALAALVVILPGAAGLVTSCSHRTALPSWLVELSWRQQKGDPAARQEAKAMLLKAESHLSRACRKYAQAIGRF